MLKKFLLIVLGTIVLYRTVSYIIIFFYGNTAWWHGVYTDQWNHYQLGALLVVVYLIFKYMKMFSPYRLSILAIGLGMIIDEVTDVLKLFHLGHLPPNFRDSFQDLLLIVGTYCAFAGILILCSIIRVMHYDR